MTSTSDHVPRITADDLDDLGDRVPRRDRHRLAHHLNRRLLYATTSPDRCPAPLRQPHTRLSFARLDVQTRVQIVSRHLIESWIVDGHARRAER